MIVVDRLTAGAGAVRRAPLGAVALRAAVGLAALAGIAATVLAPWDTPTLLVWLAGVAAVMSVAIPDSLAPTMYVLAIATSWALLGDDDIDGWLVAAVLSALVVHNGCAFAGSMPLDCEVRRPVVGRWLVATGWLALLTLAAIAVLALLAGAELGGAVWLTLAAVIGVAALAWWWAS